MVTIERWRESKKTKGNKTHTIETDVGATCGLQLFIIKSIPCFVQTHPLPTQFFYTGPLCLVFTRSRLYVHLVSLFHISFSPFLVKKDRLRVTETARDKKKKKWEGEWRREQICRTAWRPAWGHACHFSFHPSRLLAGAYAHKSAYCTWASAELRWVGGGSPQASAPL